MVRFPDTGQPETWFVNGRTQDFSGPMESRRCSAPTNQYTDDIRTVIPGGRAGGCFNLVFSALRSTSCCHLVVLLPGPWRLDFAVPRRYVWSLWFSMCAGIRPLHPNWLTSGAFAAPRTSVGRTSDDLRHALTGMTCLRPDTRGRRSCSTTFTPISANWFAAYHAALPPPRLSGQRPLPANW